MDLKTLTNPALIAALIAAQDAVKNPRGSANLKMARRTALVNIKAECQRRIDLGAW